MTKCRYLLGTLYLIILLILVFQVRLLITDWLGYPSVKEMLASLRLRGRGFDPVEANALLLDLDGVEMNWYLHPLREKVSVEFGV